MPNPPADSGSLQLAREGSEPALTLSASRGEIWRGEELVASLGRSRLLFRLLDFVAVHGPDADRESLYTTVWDQLYLGTTSDNALHVAVNRLRQRLKSSKIKIVPTLLGAFAIEGEPAVLRRHPSRQPAPQTITAPTNLTSSPEPIIGRQADLSRIHTHFEEGGRVLTVVGTGGVGKTRLVRNAGLMAAQTAGAPPGGIWFVDLSEQRTSASMVEAITEVLEVSLKDCTTAQAAVTKLQSAIGQRGNAWLILDNFEQLVDVASDTVGALVAAAPEARFLITSRERLGLPEETILKLGTLTVEESAQLFLDRAQAIRPDLNRSPEVQEAAEAIGRALEGIPLAIELAAARARVLAPAQILERLSQALRLLSAPNRQGPARHSTLRATLDWSWDLLEPWEQAALAQLSVFQGGFTMDAAEAVVANHDRDDGPWVMDVLEALIDQSLLHPMEGPGDARLTMYRSVQEFAREKLRLTGDPAEALARHLTWIIEEGERRLEEEYTPAGPQARQALRSERDNLFSAHEAAQKPEEIIRTALVLTQLLWLTGPLSTMSRVLDAADRVSGSTPALAARLAAHRGWLLHQTGSTEAGETLLLQTLETVRAAGTIPVQADVLRKLGDINFDQGNYAEAQDQFEAAAQRAAQAGERAREGQHRTTLGGLHRVLNRTHEAREALEAGLAIHREVGDHHYEAIALGGLASLANLLGASDEAMERSGEALKIFQATGDLGGESHLLENLGNLHIAAGRADEAMSCFERAMDIAQARGMILHQAAIATNLAMAHLDVGELAAAEDLLRRAIVAHRSHGRRLYEGAAMIRLAMVLLDRGRPPEAAPLLDGAVEILEQIGAPRFAAYARAWRGLTQALAGDMAGATATLSDAHDVLASVNDSLGQSLCEVLRGQAHPDEASDRISHARQPGPPTGDHPDGSPDPASRSVDIRLAIRLLERANA